MPELHHDSGQCRICKRRKNINRAEVIIRHKYQGRMCDGSRMRPVDGSISRAPANFDVRRHRKVHIIERVQHMQKVIDLGLPDSGESMQRARGTLQHFRARL